MTHESRTIYTCDRCQQEEDRAYTQAPPSDWHRLMVTRPLLASPLEAVHSQRTDVQLCAECAGDLFRWLGPGGSR